MKPNLVLLAVAGAAVYLLASRQAKAQPPRGSAAATMSDRKTITPTGRSSPGLVYANPQNQGELLARAVNTAFGIFSSVPKTATAQASNTAARDAIRASEGPGYYGWSGPTISAYDPGINASFNVPFGWLSEADSVIGGPVYNVGQDLDVEPWLYAEFGG